MEEKQVICNLKKFMESRDLTITQVAEEVGIAKNTVRSYYRNQMIRIDIDIAKKFCDYLQVCFGELFTYNPDPEYKLANAENSSDE